MTFTFRGHVEEMSAGGNNEIVLKLRGESAICYEPFLVKVSRETAKAYMPGTTFQATIYPLPEPKP